MLFLKVIEREKRRIEEDMDILKKEKDFLTRFIESVMGPNLEKLYKLQEK